MDKSYSTILHLIILSMMCDVLAFYFAWCRLSEWMG